MTNFFKNIGKGFLYIFVLPFFLVAMAIYGVFGIFVFLFECLKGVFLFFTGRRLFDDFPEDIEAKEIMAQAQETIHQSLQPQVQPQMNPMYGQQQVPPQFQQPQMNPMYGQQQVPPQMNPMYGQQQVPPQYQQPLPEEYFKDDDSIENAVFKNGQDLGDKDE